MNLMEDKLANALVGAQSITLNILGINLSVKNSIINFKTWKVKNMHATFVKINLKSKPTGQPDANTQEH